MTVHGAKGLEAPIVILPDTAPRPDGGDPPQILAGARPAPRVAHARRRLPAALAAAESRRRARAAAENRRLLYVALTRGRDPG